MTLEEFNEAVAPFHERLAAKMEARRKATEESFPPAMRLLIERVGNETRVWMDEQSRLLKLKREATLSPSPDASASPSPPASDK